MPRLLADTEIYVIRCCEDTEQDTGARPPAHCCSMHSYVVSSCDSVACSMRPLRPNAGWRGAAEVHGDLDDETVRKNRCCRLLWHSSDLCLCRVRHSRLEFIIFMVFIEGRLDANADVCAGTMLESAASVGL